MFQPLQEAAKIMRHTFELGRFNSVNFKQPINTLPCHFFISEESQHVSWFVGHSDILITYYPVVLVCFLVTIQGSWLCLGLARRNQRRSLGHLYLICTFRFQISSRERLLNSYRSIIMAIPIPPPMHIVIRPVLYP